MSKSTQAEAVVSKVSFIRSYERHKMQQHTREQVSRRKKKDPIDMLLIISSLSFLSSVHLHLLYLYSGFTIMPVYEVWRVSFGL